MEPLTSPVRRYAWGSRTVLATVQGRQAPTDEPEAELWVGAHPDSPSTLERGGDARPLDAVVAADPDGELGPAVAARWGGRLPFLFKLLAAEAPLSLQVHPDDAQARAGFDAEEAAGVPAGAPTRSFVDAWGKPEMVCAVTPFEVLVGFRPVADAIAVLAALDVPELAPHLATLRAAPGADGVREVVAAILTAPERERGALAAAVAGACDRVGPGPWAADHACAADLGRRHPRDAGAVVALLMNRLTLPPDAALFLRPGVLHAYLHGTAVEAMACSDNVLRGGLTGKRVDVAEFLRVLRVDPGPPEPLEPAHPAPGVRVWAPPVPDFALTRVDLDAAGDGAVLDAPGPRVLFCLDGKVDVSDAAGTAALSAGRAGYLGAGAGPARLTGTGTVFQTSVGPAVFRR